MMNLMRAAEKKRLRAIQGMNRNDKIRRSRIWCLIQFKKASRIMRHRQLNDGLLLGKRGKEWKMIPRTAQKDVRI